MLVVELAREDLKELVDHVEPLVEDFDALAYVEVMGGSTIEGFKFGVVPKEFGGVEDFAVQVDEVAFDEDFAHLLGNLFARKGDFSFLRKVGGQLFGVVDRLLDQLFKGR